MFSGCEKDDDPNENEVKVPSTWTKAAHSPLGNNVVFRQFICGGGTFVVTASTSATDDGSNVIMYSTDGVTWSTVSNDPLEGTRINGIAYGNGRFVAGTHSPAKVAYSLNGKDWILASDYIAINQSAINNIAYGVNGFIICDYDALFYSTDGNTWTRGETTILGEATWNFRIFYSGNKYFARTGSGVLAYSTDGRNWSGITNGMCGDGRAVSKIVYGNGRYVATGSISVGDTRTGKLAYSTDGIKWTDVPNPFSSNPSFFSIAYGAGIFIIGDENGNTAYSTDGIKWTSIANDFTERITNIEYGNGRFIFVYNNELFYSDKIE